LAGKTGRDKNLRGTKKRARSETNKKKKRLREASLKNGKKLVACPRVNDQGGKTTGLSKV